MIKLEAIQQFTLGRFNELTNITRKGMDKEGELFVGDTFECNVDLAEYLTGKNDRNLSVAKIIEIIPEEVEPKNVKIVKNELPKKAKKKASK